MRSFVLLVVMGFAVWASGCSSSSQVAYGEHGATSPAESGQQGAFGDQAAPEQQTEAKQSDYEIKPIEVPITNDIADASMEMSGNIAAQGNYKEVLATEQKKPSPSIQ